MYINTVGIADDLLGACHTVVQNDKARTAIPNRILYDFASAWDAREEGSYEAKSRVNFNDAPKFIAHNIACLHENDPKAAKRISELYIAVEDYLKAEGLSYNFKHRSEFDPSSPSASARKDFRP